MYEEVDNNNSDLISLKWVVKPKIIPLEAPIPEELEILLQSLAGQLNWAATLSQPDVSFQACQTSAMISKSTMEDVQVLNKTIKYMINNPLFIQLKRVDFIQKATKEKGGMLEFRVVTYFGYVSGVRLMASC